MTPTPSRFKAWPEIRQANAELAKVCAAGTSLHFIATEKFYLDETGKPIEKYFVEDMLHQNREGYQVWSRIVKEHLDKVLGSQLLCGHTGKLLADEKSPKDKSAAEKRHLVVTGQVMKEYALREKLSPSDQEIQELVREAARKYSGNFGPDAESQQNLAVQTMFVIATSCEWRTAKALHEKYGGRVAISSFGAWVSIEGRNAVLKDYAAAGDIKFADSEIEAAFWEKTKDERVLDVTISADRVAGLFKVAPWKQWNGEQALKDSEAKRAKALEPKPLPAKRY